MARALVQSLDCAVLAMRYPVGDQFAIELGRGLFQGVLEEKRSLARALQVTLPEVMGQRGGRGGRDTYAVRRLRAETFDVPEGESPVRLGLSYFPPEPERFVGRVGS